MSMESAVAFYERMERDEDVVGHIKQLGDVGKIEAYVRNELGYEFTQEEMQKVVFERNPELTDEELEAVVGGMSNDQLLTYVAVGLGGATVGMGAATVILGAAAAAAA